MDLSAQDGQPVVASQKDTPSHIVVGDVTTATTAVTSTTIHKSKHQPPNRIQNSVRLLLKQASEFQQQQQQQKNHNGNTNTGSNSVDGFNLQVTKKTNSSVSNNNSELPPGTVRAGVGPAHVVIDDAPHPHPPVLLKQAGVALQQQIRGLRRRVKSARSLQIQQQQQLQHSSTSKDIMIEGNNRHHSESNENHDDVPLYLASTTNTPARAQIVSPSNLSDDTIDTLDVAKLTPKKISPISKKTIKLELHDEDRFSSSHTSVILSHPESLQQAIHVWFDACYDLLTGPDMMRLLHSTGYLYYHGIRFSIHAMTLPITVPVNIGYNFSHMIVQATLSILPISSTTTVNCDKVPLLSQHQTSGQVSEEGDENLRRDHGDASGWLGGLLSIPGTIFDITGKVVIAIVAPVLGSDVTNTNHQKQSTGASSSPEEKENAVIYAKTPSRCPTSATSATHRHPDYLERLRLDYTFKDVDQGPRRKLFSAGDDDHAPKEFLACPKIPISIQNVEQSEFLLRVNDLAVSRPTDECDLFYIDVSPSAMKSNRNNNQELVSIALDRFVHGAFLLLRSHPICRIIADSGRNCCDGNSPIQQHLAISHIIQWHPEGPTKRLLRERSQAILPNQTNPFKEEILIWSGRFQHEIQDGYGRKHGFFLARGCIPMSPDKFVKLLWDNTRTSEYNNFCLGRFTLHGLSCSSSNDDDLSFLNGSCQTASKVIQSEMRVPFAGITVKAICLMHVRPLSTNDGYIICSRSLDAGPSGIQTVTACKNNAITPAKNEILWGVNIIRSMPNHPNGTELTSLSQVGSAVPSFLAQKIGLMGIGDFFKNVRQVAEKNIHD